MSQTEERPAHQRITAPRIELLCPGCRGLQEFPAESRAEEVTCPECGWTFHAPGSAPVLYVPWEDRSRIGWPKAVGRTVWTSILAPRAFFERMPIEGGWLSPVAYAALMCFLAVVGSSAWGFLVALPNRFPEMELTWQVYLHVAFVMVLPMAVMALAFFTVLLHLAVLLLKGTAPSMQTSARVVAYSTNALLFSLIPVIGPPLAFLWFLYLCIVGIREAQEFSTAKAALAALSPLLLFLLLLSGTCRPPDQG